MKKHRGFTLVELLIVISIIGILASMVMTPAPGLLKKSRDSRVKQTMASLRTAIKSYWMVNDGKYPGTLGELTPDFIDSVPLKWQGANFSGIIVYDKKVGTVKLADDQGRRNQLPQDGKGLEYSKY